MEVKIAAMTKLAEVNGVLAGLIDSEVITVASPEDFDKLAELVVAGLPDEYDMDAVLAKTAEIIAAEEALAKEAEVTPAAPVEATEVEKLAALSKLAEVNGVLAGLVDSEIIAVDTAEDFDKLAEMVSEGLGAEYDMDAILAKTAEIVNGIEKDAAIQPGKVLAAVGKAAGKLGPNGKKVAMGAGMVAGGAAAAYGLNRVLPPTVRIKKEASEIDEKDLLAAYGALHIQKEAGDITEAEFTKEATELFQVAEDLQKEAADSEAQDTAMLAAYGALHMQKEAGEITEEEFTKEAASIKELWGTPGEKFKAKGRWAKRKATEGIEAGSKGIEKLRARFGKKD